MDEGVSSVNELTENDRFIRWVEGNASAEEAEVWDRWINQSPAHRRLARVAQQKVLELDFAGRTYLDATHAWSKLERRINQNNSLGNVIQKYHDRYRGRVLNVAAVLMITAFVGIASYFMFVPESNGETASAEWKRIETEYGELKKIDLSDGSSIALNANSALTYPRGWLSNTATEVYLEGEAYFSISKRVGSNARPFRVKTEDGTVEVLGTRFMVASDEHDTKVVLEEGAVSILKETGSAASGDGSAVEPYRMKPNQMAQFSRDNKSISISKIPNTKVFTSWFENMLVLDSSPFGYLVERIENTYGVHVEVHDEELYKRKLTGSIKLKKLDYLIQALSDVMGIDVSLSDGTVFFGKINSK